MTWSGRRLWLRLALAGGAAGAMVFVLHQVVAARDGRQVLAEVRHQPAPSPLATLGFRLEPIAGEVLLASRLEALPPGVAPVLQVLADGTLAVRRVRPLAAAPVAAGAADAAGVLVPGQPLARWSPAARGALVEVLAALVGPRPVEASHVQVVDQTIGAAELRALCAWVP